LAYIIKKTSRQKLDIYDLAALSSVAVIPCLFVFFPGGFEKISRFLGVAFPFVVMFGAILAILFIFVHKLTVKIHFLENENRLLVQRLSLLQYEAKRASKSAFCLSSGMATSANFLSCRECDDFKSYNEGRKG
jgi:hypothetical protein